MKGRLFIVASLIGSMMTCTLVTVQASDYRKEKTELCLSKFEVTPISVVATADLNIVAVNLFVTNFNPVVFLVPVSKINFYTSVIYLRPVNKGKPKNRQINGLLNDRRESERISYNLRS